VPEAPALPHGTRGALAGRVQGPLRVLLIGKDATLGDAGAGVAADTRERHLGYARALRARRPGSELRVVYYRPAARGGGDEAPVEGLRLYPTRSRHRAAFLADLARTLPRALAGGWRPHLVSVQTPWEEGVAGWALARALGARFVPQLHFDLFAPTFAGEHPLNRWRRRVAGRVLRAGDAVRVVSAGLREGVVRELGVAPARVCVVPVGVRFEPAAGPAAAHRAALFPGLGGAPLVLYVGKFHPRKNLPLWIEAARRIAARVPAARFALAGDGPDEAAVRGAAAAAGLADRTSFLGALPYERLPALFAAADLFMLSSDNEGFGRVVVEAGLAGLPVVATDCPGPRDLLAEGGGVLVPRGDAGALAAAVAGLLEDPAARRAMGEAGRARMHAAFGAAALVERLVDCWEAAARVAGRPSTVRSSEMG
jgi:glycosyltransferase involved in cell wall biosynthesis